MTEVFPGDVRGLAEAVRSGAVEPDHWIRESLERIAGAEGADPPLRAFLSVADPDDLGGSLGDPPTGALAGVPVAVKDNLTTLDLPTTCASRILEGYHSPFEATAVRRLRKAGGVVVGKSNMDEFAMGSSTESSAFGPTRNPRAPGRVPGGSSGGSAAAVSAGLVPVALGSDTGGSVRQPAAFCGVVGIRPTWGRVSRYGLVAYASSLDQVGVFGATVRDATLLLQAVAGHDPRDARSAERPVPNLVERLEEGAEGLVIGLPREYFGQRIEPVVEDACRRAARVLEELGAELRFLSLPHTRHALPAYYVLAPAEASSNLARFDGVRFGPPGSDASSVEELNRQVRSRGFGAEVKRRILLGTFVLSEGYHEAYYRRALRVRRRVTDEFRRAFREVDLLLTPTTPTRPFPLGERTGDPYRMYRADSLTVPASLAGLPAASIPAGVPEELPIGVQLVAPAWEEVRLLRAAAALERALGGGR